MHSWRVNPPPKAAEELAALPERVPCAELKARQAVKIRQIGEALVNIGYRTLEAQAEALGLSRSTAWTIVKAGHKTSGISAGVIRRMLSSRRLPEVVRAKVVEYAIEKATGSYGGSKTQHRRFASKVDLEGAARSQIGVSISLQTSSRQKAA